MNADERALRASREPLSWLILADMLEERGDPLADWWRRLGQWGSVLLPLWGQVGTHDFPREVQLSGGFCCRLDYRPKRIYLSIYRQPRPAPFLEYHLIRCPDEPTTKQWRYIWSRLRAICAVVDTWPNKAGRKKRPLEKVRDPGLESWRESLVSLGMALGAMEDEEKEGGARQGG